MNNSKTFVALVVIAIIAIGAYFFPTVSTIVGGQGPKGDKGDSIVGPQGPAGKDGRNGIDGKDAPAKLGSVAGPNSYFDFVANNDLQKFGKTVRMVGTAASTTVCAIKSPPATSTLAFAGVNFTTSSTTGSVVTLAKATTAFATTTVLNNLTLAANAQGAQIATSSMATLGIVPSIIFAPNTYFVVGMQDTTPEAGTGHFSPVGSCSAEFVRI